MSRNISNPDFITGNGLLSSFDSDLDEEFAPQAYHNTNIYEQSMFYESPLGKCDPQHRTLKHNSNDRG
jgi:hypothetical protein